MTAFSRTLSLPLPLEHYVFKLDTVKREPEIFGGTYNRRRFL